MELAVADILSRLLAAAGLGAVFGWDRERRDKPAGLRTHMMVSLGAACFCLLGLAIFEQLYRPGAQIDPLRIVEGVAGGLGFLGGGTIIKQGDSARGLTTAAGIWTAGGVGAACGLGMYVVASLATAIAFGVLLMDRWTERGDHPEGGHGHSA